MSLLSTQSYKGTRDFYPQDQRIRNWMFDKIKKVVRSYGYEEYDGPMLEPFELYAAKTGEEIVNQQLYSLIDRADRKLAVRPEMTPTLARMVAAKIQELPQPIRWYSIPNLWRYERPQRGRLREHWQLNVDVLGGQARWSDTEVLSVALSIFEEFGGLSKFQLKVNNRRLMDYFFAKVLHVDRTTQNSLVKLLDAKGKMSPEKYLSVLNELGLSESQKSELDRLQKSDFNEIAKSYDPNVVRELKDVMDSLHAMGWRDAVVFDPTIMRGMDYYTGTVFEGYDTSPDNTRALFGGGRYDNLVGLFVKNTLSGMGFGLGDVSLQNFLETHKLLPGELSQTDAFILFPKEEVFGIVTELAKNLRKAGLCVATALEVSGFGSQLKTADKLKARFAVIPGEEELKNNQVMLKNLKSGEQKQVAIPDLAGEIKKSLL